MEEVITLMIDRWRCGCDRTSRCDVHQEVLDRHLSADEEIALLRERRPDLFEPPTT